jgi:hypothetical protein
VYARRELEDIPTVDVRVDDFGPSMTSTGTPGKVIAFASSRTTPTTRTVGPDADAGAGLAAVCPITGKADTTNANVTNPMIALGLDRKLIDSSVWRTLGGER